MTYVPHAMPLPSDLKSDRKAKGRSDRIAEGSTVKYSLARGVKLRIGAAFINYNARNPPGSRKSIESA